jgi:two-component sensor histidine kinase
MRQTETFSVWFNRSVASLIFFALSLMRGAPEMPTSLIKWGIERSNSIWQVGLPPRSIASLTFAVACVGIATIVRTGLGLISPDSAVFAPYYSATLVAALVGGPTSGIVAAVLGGVVAYWRFVPPEWSATPFVVEQLVSLSLYAMSSVVIIWAAESYHSLLQRLRETERTRQLFNNELAHRIKNTLASVQAIVSQTLKDQPDVRNKLNTRIIALGATNDLLMKSEWQTASLRKILAGEFIPYDPSRFQLVGEEVECPSAIAIFLALIFHELTTNAIKYGALSKADGRVSVSWKLTGDRLELEWVERGGPKPGTRVHVGFGTTLLQAGLKQFNGSVDMQFEPTGLRVMLSMILRPDFQGRSLGIAREELRRQTNISESGLIAKIH